MLRNYKESSAYYPAIDGLRALAVLGVLFYHADLLFPSGFVGVDVFFVISGFVVAHSAGTLPADSLSRFLGSFYARRIARIAPALLACLVTTFLMSALFVPQGWLSNSNGKVGLGAFFGVSNYLLVLTADGYWSPRTEFNPFTHTWSLGVEEQFYLIIPWLFFASRAGKSRWAVTILLTLMGLSVLAAVLQSPSGLAFYSLHTRFWELGIGVALSLTSSHWQPVISRWRRGFLHGVALASAAGLLAALVAVPPSSFPWPWAVLPVFATAFAIVTVVAAPAHWWTRLLSLELLRVVGTRSYSLYLWHWPVIVLARWTTGLESFWAKATVILVSACLAEASYRLIERPARQAARVREAPRWQVVTLGVATIGVFAFLAAAITVGTRHLSLSVTRNEDVWNPGARVAVDNARCGVRYADAQLGGGKAVSVEPSACAPTPRAIFVLGDSHAWAYTPLVGLLVQHDGWVGYVLSKPGCQFASLRRPMREDSAACQQFGTGALEWIRARARSGDVLFLPGLRVDRLRDQWGGVAAGISDPVGDPAAEEEAVALLTPFAERGVLVIFEQPKPVFRAPAFRCSDWFNRSNPVCEGGFSELRTTQERHRTAAVQSIQSVVSRIPHAKAWDPLPTLCTNAECTSFVDGIPLFFDGDHLSQFGNTVLWPSFRGQVISGQ